MNIRKHVEDAVNEYYLVKAHTVVAVGTVGQEGTNSYCFGEPIVLREKLSYEDALFEIGSITKPFTSALLVDMARDGLVDIHDPISKYLPENLCLPYGGQITLIQLATHTSGLPCLPDNLEASIREPLNPYAHYRIEELYRYLENCRLHENIFEYSNLGAGLLGHILELASGVSYDSLVKTHITSQLDMHDTCIKLNDDQRRRMIPGHLEDGSMVPGWDFDVLAGCGAIRSSIKDLLKFLSVNLGIVKTELETVYDECHKVRVHVAEQNIKIGLGWLISGLQGTCREMVWHNGGTGGYRSFLGLVKETKTGVVVLANTARPVDLIGVNILKILNNE